MTVTFIAHTLVKDLTGKRFGRLVVLGLHKLRGKSQGAEWECLCDCGNVSYPLTCNLIAKRGNTRSCGCLALEQRRRPKKHGQANTKAYNTHIQRKREAAKKQRIPPWSDLDAIREFYVNCPKGMTVDHIIPLQGKEVSGLHVPANLQYLTHSENARKRIKFQPRFEIKGETPKWFDEMGLGL